MGIFCKVCLSVGEGHDKEQLCVIGGGASLFRRTVSSWSRRPDSTTLKWGRAWCVQKMGRETKNTEKLGRRVNQSPWQGAGQKARVQMLFLTAKTKQRKGRKGNFCKASRSSLERVRCSKLQVSGASRKFREKAVLALQIPSAQVRFFFSSNEFHPWFALSGFLGPLVQLHPSKKPPVKTYRKLHSRDLMDCWQEVSNLALDPGTLYIFRFSAIMPCLCSLPVRWLSMFWFSSWEMWSLGKTTFGFAWSPWRTALIVNTHCVPGNTLGTLEASGNLTYMIQRSWHYNLVYA